VISAFLYLRIMVSVWLQEPEAGDDTREAVRVPFSTGLAITLCAGFTLLVGFYPSWLIDASERVTQLTTPLTG
jgi:NADH:ubiquinone oxidoreductase subunit 2 (subunit N)